MNKGVLGIDFGDEFSVVGVAKKGSISIAINDFSNRKTPSIIAFLDPKREIGESASFRHAKNYRNTIHNFKSLIDSHYESQNNTFALQPPSKPGHCASVAIQSLHKNMPPTVPLVSVLAVLLKHLRSAAQKHSEVTAKDCAIAVPADFAEPQRRVIATAARIAGLHLNALLSESAAAALSYGISKSFGDDTKLVLFLDIGHSASTASIVSFTKNKLKVLRTARVRKGGADFTSAIVSLAVEKASKANGIDSERLVANAKAMIRLTAAVNKAKKILSVNKESRLFVDSLQDENDLVTTVKREEMESVIKDDVEKIVGMVRKILADTKTTALDYHSFELIGGSSRVPFLKREIENLLQTSLSTTCDADEVIANGCTLRSAMASSLFRVRPYEVIDCFPFAVRMSWGDVSEDFQSPNYNYEDSSILFGEFSPLPSAKKVSFLKDQPFQVVFTYESPEKLSRGTNAFIARLIVRPEQSDEIDGAPPSKINVKVALDSNGYIRIRKVETQEEIMVPVETPPEVKTAENEKKTVENKAKTVENEEKMENDTENTSEMDQNDEKMDQKDEKTKEKITEKQKSIPKKTKRKIITQNVPFKVFRMGYSEEEIELAINVEKSMEKHDHLIETLGELKNDLESLVFASRSKIDGELKEFRSEETASALMKELEENENWLYSEEANTTECIPKLKERLLRLSEEIQTIQNRKIQKEKREQEEREKDVPVEPKEDEDSAEKEVEKESLEEKKDVPREQGITEDKEKK